VASLEDHHVVDTPAWNNVSEKRELIIARRKPKISMFFSLKRERNNKVKQKYLKLNFPVRLPLRYLHKYHQVYLAFHTNQLFLLLGYLKSY